MEEMVNEIGPGQDKEFRLGSIIVDWAWSRPTLSVCGQGYGALN